MKILFKRTLLLWLIFISCVSNVENLSDDVVIEPEIVSYVIDIQPIFNGSCGGGGCHITSSTNGVNLSNFQKTLSSRGTSYSSLVIIPNKADLSPLIDKIEVNPTNGSRMPLGRSALTPSQIATLKAWINQGALNN